MFRPFIRRGNTQQVIRLCQEIFPIQGRCMFSRYALLWPFRIFVGLIVFQDIEEAKLWGSCWAKVQLKAENKKYYLVKFKYTPSSGLKTHGLVLIVRSSQKSVSHILLRFTTGDSQWKQFVNDSYKKAGAKYDIVEGPVSVGRESQLFIFMVIPPDADFGF